MIKVLFFGDIVGKIGRTHFLSELPRLKEIYKPDLIIVNGENSANGRGITEKIYQKYINAGVHCVTSGNHIFDNRDIYDRMNDFTDLIRPANCSELSPGNSVYTTTLQGVRIAVVSLMGQVFMPPTDSPFSTFDRLLESELKDVPVILVDFHAEATSEKQAFGQYYASLISAMIGTHTHVQTADACILKEHAAYITDVGMIGAYNSILGMGSDSVIERFRTQMPIRMDPPQEDEQLLMNYVYMEIGKNGKASKIKAENVIKESGSD